MLVKEFFSPLKTILMTYVPLEAHPLIAMTKHKRAPLAIKLH